MITNIVSRLVILVFGTLYPAYASYKAIRTKNLKDYVKWMMYWIVFALFTCAETFTDVFLGFWFPFYYEIKIITVLWLLSPATKGSSILYRKFVHPMLTKREQEIDEYISKAKEQGYSTVLSIGSKGVNYATTVIMQTAIKNLNMLNAVVGDKELTALPNNNCLPSKISDEEDGLSNTDVGKATQSYSELEINQTYSVEFSDDEDIEYNKTVLPEDIPADNISEKSHNTRRKTRSCKSISDISSRAKL